MKKIILGTLLGFSCLLFTGCTTQTTMMRRCVDNLGRVQQEYFCETPLMYPGYVWYYGGPTYVPYGVVIHGGYYNLPHGYSYSSPRYTNNSTTIINNNAGGGSTRGIFGGSSQSSSVSTPTTRSFGSSFTTSSSSGISRGVFGGSFSSGGFGG